MRYTKAIIGAAVAGVAVASVAVINQVTAANTASSLVPITPCRLLDTRAESPVGEHPGALTTSETATLAVTGAHGNCNIPAATGIVANVTIVRPTAPSFLQLYPADSPRPGSGSNLNWVADQEPTPNQVTVGLSADGRVSMFNLAGNVEVIIDIAGYYEAARRRPRPEGRSRPERRHRGAGRHRAHRAPRERPLRRLNSAL